MEIRQLRSDDHDAWFRLRSLLWPETSPDELEREQREIISDLERNSVLLASLPHGELIGFVEVSIRDWAEGCSTRPVGYIEGWLVRPEYRRRQVGRRLIETAEQWALSGGCREMGSDAELGNEVSRLAHQSLGYEEVAQLICFAKKLGQSNTDA